MPYMTFLTFLNYIVCAISDIFDILNKYIGAASWMIEVKTFQVVDLSFQSSDGNICMSVTNDQSDISFF